MNTIQAVTPEVVTYRLKKPSLVSFRVEASFSEHIERGDSYHRLKKTISISLLDFKLFDRKRLYSLYELLERFDHQPFADMLQMVFIELPKATSGIPKDNPKIPAHLHRWVEFLNIESATQLKKLPKNNPAIQEACEMLNKINQNPAERALAEARRKGQLDYNTNMIGERRAGLKEGLEIAARAMKLKGIEIAQIAEMTGLSEEDIESLER